MERRFVAGLALLGLMLAIARGQETLPAPPAESTPPGLPAENAAPAEAIAPQQPAVSTETPAPPAVASPAESDPSASVAEPVLRGPIHEAFAEPIALQLPEPLVVEQEPPQAIEELPPDPKPEGERVEWIPGYWSWDEEKKDFLWISGVWRKIPQGRQWISGTWEKVERGFQWIPGRWQPLANGPNAAVPAAGAAVGAANDLAAEPILPLPPESLEQGPNQDPPSTSHFWIPGVWQYRGERYLWRPGFWSPCHDHWVWVPDHYVRRHGGCIYVPGYWDYAWEHRGRLYAPCHINRTMAYRPGYVYSPTVAINITDAFIHLWVRPGYHHYYFGDYYDPTYVGWGMTPWYQYHRTSFVAYDPLFVHYRWQFARQNVDFYRCMHDRHAYHQRNINSRPDWHWRGHGIDGGLPGGGLAFDASMGMNPRHASSARIGTVTQKDAFRRELLARMQQTTPDLASPGHDLRRGIDPSGLGPRVNPATLGDSPRDAQRLGTRSDDPQELLRGRSLSDAHARGGIQDADRDKRFRDQQSANDALRLGTDAQRSNRRRAILEGDYPRANRSEDAASTAGNSNLNGLRRDRDLDGIPDTGVGAASALPTGPNPTNANGGGTLGEALERAGRRRVGSTRTGAEARSFVPGELNAGGANPLGTPAGGDAGATVRTPREFRNGGRELRPTRDALRENVLRQREREFTPAPQTPSVAPRNFSGNLSSPPNGGAEAGSLRRANPGGGGREALGPGVTRPNRRGRD